ncbi:MAG TPA: DUF2339 domain-containing protein [Verrucomicrobiae bacterium]|nr:DUF2339 domain-containing protein [Verrucomicrobiae bacterium]
MPFVIFIIFLLVVGLAVLASLAYVRSARAERELERTPKLIARIYDAEQRLAALEKRGASLDAGTFSGSPAEGPPGRDEAAPAHAEKLSPDRPTPAPAAPATPPGQPVRPEAQVHSPSPAAPLRSPGAPPPHAAASPPSSQPPHASPLSMPPSSRESSGDVEAVIAGRWLNYVGILALALAVSYFIKYAFDNNWIGPGGRVALGLVAGSALYPLGQWIFRKGYVFYSEGITALGAAILYLSVWAGWRYYHIFPQEYAFPMMIVITAVTAAVAATRDSQRLAFLAGLGGLLTPILVSTGQNAETVLFGYLLILGAGMLAISWLKDWKTLPPLQFFAALLYFWSWYGEYYAEYELQQTMVFATLFFALFAALPIIRSSRNGKLTGLEIFIVLSNATQYLIALRLMLWPEYRWGLTFFMVALAAVHFAAERAVPRNRAASSEAARMVYAGLGLTFLTLTIPIRLDGKWITIAWAVEGAMLVWSGLRIRMRLLRSAGLLLFLIVAIRLIAFPIQAEPVFLLNSRFLTIAMCAASFLAAYILAAFSEVQLDTAETQLYMALGGAANLLLLIGLSLDVWDLYGRMPSLGIDRSLAQQLALSVLWLFYASVLMGAGVKWKSASLRWQSLLLLGVVIAKVFFFDLYFLTRFYRILSAFLLGLVLLVVSFLYQRRARPGTGGSAS